MPAAGIRSRFAAPLAILILAAGCALPERVADHLDGLDLGPLPPTPPPNALMCGSSTDTTDQRQIGSAGGRLGLPDGHALVVRPNTVNQPVRFHMTQRAADYIFVKFGPGNRPFNPPVEVTLSSAACGADQPSDLVVYRWHNAGEGWVKVDEVSVARAANGRALTATVRAAGFTGFALSVP